MKEPITLSCPNCGGKLVVTEETDRFVCSYCGNEHIVKRGEGVISLQPVVSGLMKVDYRVANVQQGVDKTASELAIRRLQEEISLLRKDRSKKRSAWTGDRARLGCVAFFVSCFPAFVFGFVSLFSKILPFPGSTTIGIISFSIPLLVLGYVFYFINLDKKIIEKKQNDLDNLISSKIDELSYHQNIVSLN